MVGFLTRRIKSVYQKWGLFLRLSKDGVISQHNPMVHVLQFPPEGRECVATSIPFNVNSLSQVRTLAPGSLLTGRVPVDIGVKGRLLQVLWPERQLGSSIIFLHSCGPWRCHVIGWGWMECCDGSTSLAYRRWLGFTINMEVVHIFLQTYTAHKPGRCIRSHKAW